jgi:putative addiction module killer protein
MNTINQSKTFETWLDAQDRPVQKRVQVRITRAEGGNFGDAKPVGEGIMEMRLDFGPGYRLYYTRRGEAVYWLLVGGDKSTQQKDIERAKEIARDIGE